MSLRAISIAAVSSSAMADDWCGSADSIEVRPKMSPGPGVSSTTSWLSSSITTTRTCPLSTTYASLAHVAGPVDALARGEPAQLDLIGQHRALVGVEQREDRDLFEHPRIASHVGLDDSAGDARAHPLGLDTGQMLSLGFATPQPLPGPTADPERDRR